MSEPAELLAKLRNIGRPSILVLGDLMLDRYTWGQAERVSPEAPVLVLRVDRQEVRLGGGASVACLLQALEARVSMAGVTGDDDAAVKVRALLDGDHIDRQLVYRDPLRPTTVKERIMGRAVHRHPHQILRIDYEVRDPLPAELETRLAQAIVERLPEYQAVLVADYHKGLCTPRLMATVIAAAAKVDVPVLVDPARGADCSRYRGAAVLMPNRSETELATGREIATPEDAVAAGHIFRERCQAQAVVVKLDSQGMLLLQAGAAEELIPARPRPVQDVTGAGDMVLATVGLCRAAGLSLSEAVRIASVSAGLEVERLGVAQVSRAEVEAELAAHPAPAPQRCASQPAP